MAVSKRLRYEVLRRDNHTCRYCGRSAPEVRLTIDHVVPVTLGGKDEPGNLVAACSECNAGKSSANPDSALVAQVSDDAVRWATAVRKAGDIMVEDLRTRERARARFLEAWRRWNVRGVAVPLPAEWATSVEQFLAAGLPLEVVIDCIDVAMGVSHIRAESKFKYMCGVAWRRIRQLHDTAQGHVGGPHPDEPASTHSDAVVAWAIGYLPWCGDMAELRRMVEQFDIDVSEDEAEDGTPLSYAHWTDADKFLAKSVERLVEDHEWLNAHVGRLLGALSAEARENLMEESREAHRQAGETDVSEDEIRRYASSLIVRLLPPSIRAKRRPARPDTGSF